MELLNPVSVHRSLQMFYHRGLYRHGAVLILGSHPRLFHPPEIFQHDPAAATIEVFHNGRRLVYSPTQSPEDGEFFVTESTTGAGYDEVRLVSFSPSVRSVLSANYFAVP